LEACPAAGGAVVSPCAAAPACTVSEVRAGGIHTCALLSHGGVRCAPAPPSAGHTQAPLRLHLCVPARLALTPPPRGRPRCWGDRNGRGGGQLGMGNTDSVGSGNSHLEVASLADVDLGAGRTAVQLALGKYHTCALLNDGQLCAPRPPSLPSMGCVSLA